MEAHGHEQLCVFTDTNVGLKAFIAIHDTTLGPALGGVRFWPHKTEDDALMDVLRLSKGMTYKSAAAGLDFGGGKALIVCSNDEKTEAMLRSFGKCVESLGGRYITTEDVGATTDDIEIISKETSHIAGLSLSLGGSGDPSEMTAYGIYEGMKACASEVWGHTSLRNRKVAVQGFGKVAYYLSKHLIQDDIKVIVADINSAAQARAKNMGLEVLNDADDIYNIECDIFAPCALGGIINDKTVPMLKCKIVAGSANNQLLEDKHASMLQNRGILYAPDYLINAGGVINISVEIGQEYSPNIAADRVAGIYEQIRLVIETSKQNSITTAAAADFIAEERINSVKSSKNI
tara:strand:- start:71289 stop:72329 length:1041 start_codon:yes stop_codon:yes gene_type:complete